MSIEITGMMFFQEQTFGEMIAKDVEWYWFSYSLEEVVLVLLGSVVPLLGACFGISSLPGICD